MTGRDGHNLIAKKMVVLVGYVQKFDFKSMKKIAESLTSTLTLISYLPTAHPDPNPTWAYATIELSVVGILKIFLRMCTDWGWG